MFRVPEYNHDLSLRLSKVLDDIGVNERMVMRRRRSALLREALHTIVLGTTIYNFGSLSEGTTTVGLKSDADNLFIIPKTNLIQTYDEWQQGRINLLMIQDEETAPGYCKLQIIRPDLPLPVTDTLLKHTFQDEYNRILLSTLSIKDSSKDGPAVSVAETPANCALDIVPGYFGISWPNEARDWLYRRSGLWPTADIKRYAGNSGCMVVAAGSKISQIQQLEWRISTCKAERCLMFGLNITQLRCYVLMKMILKTYCFDPLTSYMCKTVLLHCIEISHPNEWRENKLFSRLLFCLHQLYISVLHKSCPHFIIRRNNLMAGRISSAEKNKLMAMMREIIQNLELALLRVHIDDLGRRLQQSAYPQDVRVFFSDERSILFSISASIVIGFVGAVTFYRNHFLKACSRCQCYRTVYQHVIQTLLKHLKLYREGNYIQQKAVLLVMPIFCSNFGSLLASSNIGTNNSISPEAVSWLSMGLNSDVSSGRLKLASVFYCSGDMLRTEFILRETERLYSSDTLIPVCVCVDFRTKRCKSEFFRVYNNLNEKAIQNVCAFCVSFIQTEINCIPRELQYELFRSTEEDLQYRDDEDYWMDWAVVDSFPFLYFLQYKTYGRLHKYNEQQIALTNLVRTIFTEKNLGHRETALNLLGQCCEQENSPRDAVMCYKMSLNVRKRNNAAKFHLCRVIGDMLNRVQ